MFVGKYKDFPKIDMTPSGAKGAVKQGVVGPEHGWEDYVLRVITLDVDGYSPTHTHDWPHINYVISGTGVVMTASGYLVTNAHVVTGAVTISVQLTDDRLLEAELMETTGLEVPIG